jgi:tetraacyldisaccharide 4'-kinase
MWLTKFWYQPASYYKLLLPLSYIYRLIVAGRRYLYRVGVLAQTRFSVPVIVVGNITVGGTGKTPLVIALAHALRAQGYKPGLVSRGYQGSANRRPYRVQPDSSPALVGDEALLLVKQTECPMVICRDRVAAVRELLAQTDCDLVLSDDGLQHYRLARQVEIVVIDGERRFGNGACLPAGPLREPRSRLRDVDFVICNGKPGVGEDQMQLVPQACIELVSGKQQSAETFGHVHACAGIGNPQRFFDTLRALGLQVTPHVFPDHHRYSAADFSAMQGAIVMTEKDAVKCQAFADANWWYLPIVAELEPSFIAQLVKAIR